MSSSTAVLILAAGRGTRMRSVLPKVLHPLAGKPLLGHLLDTLLRHCEHRSAIQAGVFVVCGYGADEVKKTFKDLPLTYIDQTEQLGTGHAVKQALPALEKSGAERVLILVGDTPLISKATLEALLATPSDSVGLLTANVSDATGLGRIVRDAAGELMWIVEEKDASDEEKKINEINTGIMVVPLNKLKTWIEKLTPQNAQGEYYLTDIFAMARSEEQTIKTVTATECEIASVNDKVQLAALERLVQKQQAEKLMTQGVTLLDHARFDLRGDLTVGCDVVIDINVVIEGKVSIGDRCKIGPNVVLRNVEIANDVIIKSNCDIDGAVIGEGSEVGPFARLRPGTVLSEKTKIGNFVETKKSTIGKGSKVNHLTYVGDATVGAAVNIGAGVITANYDGVNKWKTIIDDGASIGANVVLVAPVKVGEGATVGAGSVITKDAPPAELTVSRSKQQTIAGWQKPAK